MPTRALQQMEHNDCDDGAPVEAGHGKINFRYPTVAEKLRATRPGKVHPANPACSLAVQNLRERCQSVLPQRFALGAEMLDESGLQHRLRLAELWPRVGQMRRNLAKIGPLLGPNWPNWRRFPDLAKVGLSCAEFGCSCPASGQLSAPGATLVAIVCQQLRNF